MTLEFDWLKTRVLGYDNIFSSSSKDLMSVNKRVGIFYSSVPDFLQMQCALIFDFFIES